MAPPTDSKDPRRIALLPGDGQGRELANHAKKILDQIQGGRKSVSFYVSEYDFGGAALVAGADTGLPSSTLQACLASDAVLVCGCGNAKYGNRPEKGLLSLRQELGAFANIRPVRFPSNDLAQQSAFKADRVENLDITFFRDLTGGIYYGARKEANSEEDEAYDMTAYSKDAIVRLARLAGQYGMRFSPPKAVHSIDKNNVLATSRLWRSTVTEVFKEEFPQVSLDHILVDAAAMMLSSDPTSLNGIILTENMFGDILSDQSGGIIPSTQVLASAAVSSIARTSSSCSPGIFEPFDLKAQGSVVNPLGIIQAVHLILDNLGLTAEAEALEMAIRRTLDPVELVGSGVKTTDLGGSSTANEFMETLLHHVDYYLEAANSVDLAAIPKSMNQPQDKSATSSRRPMGVIEKIITNAAIGLREPHVRPGDMVCVKVDWTITSELLWGGMEKTYEQMGRPRPFRNDRLWLAVDHTVDPRSNHLPRQKGLIARAEHFRKEAKIIDFLPANTSIMHTDFTRDRAQPGRVVVGSDSHTCSAGSMGSLAVGFGAADVVMPMVTGETWFRSPEVCRINFVGQLPFGVGGKEVILHILGLFKRNTLAFQRAVEYGGPGLAELSMDARFAISNMTTEFGGMGACFEADDKTASWIAQRTSPQHRQGGLYFRADPGATYAEERTVDLSEVSLTMALYPNPDDVVPVTEKVGMQLDGCFIGACTTTEEDLIVGALVLEAGLRAGMVPKTQGKRRVTPGSLVIIKNLEKFGLLGIYRQAGFEVGAPGCSYCVGINDVDVAGEGEIWLSSQNRNFRNRMGKGSFGNVTGAAVVAASSFAMEVTDPRPLLDQLDREKFEAFIKRKGSCTSSAYAISEPEPEMAAPMAPTLGEFAALASASTSVEPRSTIITSKVQRFGENVDTDAVIPAEFMPGVDNADLGSHCFQYFRPEFREKAKSGSRIIVAETGFGSGSSREDAVRALQGSGVEAIIAKSFAFIYERNQLNMGLFNIKLQEADFFALAQEGAVITIDKAAKEIRIEGVDKIFHYQQHEIEETLLESGGVLPLYSQFGSKVFRQITLPKVKSGRRPSEVGAVNGLGMSEGPASIEW